MHLSIIVYILFSIGHAVGAPGSDLALDKRSCTPNNCVRDLKNPKYSVSASSYCSAVLRPTVYSTVSVPASAYTVVSTITPLTTTTVTSTSTEIDPTVRTTSITVYQNHYKRAAPAPIPKYASHCNAASISSACSCFLSGNAASNPTTVPITVSVTQTFPSTSTAPTQTLTSPTLTTTTIAPVETDTQTLICGIQASANADNLGHEDHFYIDASDCPAACQGVATMYGVTFQSFAYKNWYCYCFAESVAQGTHADPMGYTFYDNGCQLSYVP